MVNVYRGGVEAFDASMSIPPPPETVQYLHDTRQRFTSSLTHTGRYAYEAAKDKIMSFDYQKLGYIAKAIRRMGDNLWMDNVIGTLHDIGQFQHPPPIMRRWLMAEPTVRQLYHQGQVEGYGNDYIDRHPGQVGTEHYDWQVVMDGVVVEDEHGHDVSYEYFCNTDPAYDPDYDELDIVDKSNIIDAWAKMSSFIKANRDDPTSKWNAQL